MVLNLSFAIIVQPTITVYVGEEDELPERDVDVFCGPSEDYEENKNKFLVIKARYLVVIYQ